MKLGHVIWIILVFYLAFYIANITAKKINGEKSNYKMESNNTLTKNIISNSDNKRYFREKNNTTEKITLILNKNCKSCHYKNSNTTFSFEKIIPIIKQKTINSDNGINYITNYILTPNSNISITKVKNKEYKMPPMQGILTREEARAVATLLYDKYYNDVNKTDNKISIPETKNSQDKIALIEDISRHRDTNSIIKKIKNVILYPTRYEEYVEGKFIRIGIVNIYDDLVKNDISYEYLNKTIPFSIYISGPHTKETLDLNNLTNFGKYNPHFIKYMYKNIQKILNNKQFIRKTKKNFKKYFFKEILKYRSSYLYLHKDKKIQRFAKIYKKCLSEINTVENPEYFKFKHHDNNYTFYRYNGCFIYFNNIDYSKINNTDDDYDILINFWIRRYIDKTDKQIYNIINLFYKKYK